MEREVIRIEQEGNKPVEFTPKIVNHGNVFNTGNWYTHYCGNCGTQLNGRVETCEGLPFIPGCGAKVKWEATSTVESINL